MRGTMRGYNLLTLGPLAIALACATGVKAQECAYPTGADTPDDTTDDAQSVATVATNAGLTSLVDAVSGSSYLTAASDPTSTLTVFAPTQAAFAAASEALAGADMAALDAVLGLHIIEGATEASALSDGMALTTINGGTLTVGIADGTVMITGPSNSATVTATNIAACNSLVHLIDTVLLPAQSTTMTCMYPTGADTPDDTTDDAQSVATVATNAGLTSLVDAVAASSYLTAASDPASALTVFAPNQAAFAAASAALAGADMAALDAVLGLHIIAGATESSALTDGMQLTTLSGGMLTVGIADGTVTITGPSNAATVTMADVPACNSVVHVIDNVLLPVAAAMTCLYPTGADTPDDTTDNAQSVATVATNAGLTSLVDAVAASSYLTAASDPASALTVFAPNQAAFAAASAALAGADMAALDAVLGLHIIAGATESSALTDAMQLTTVSGAVLTVGIADGTVTITGPSNAATVTMADVPACNSVVHVIDNVLLPAAAESPATPAPTPATQPAGSAGLKTGLIAAVAAVLAVVFV